MVELLWGIHRPSDCNGFDIVIGNPPYLSSKAIIEEDKKSYSRVFKTTTKQYDLFSLFIALVSGEKFSDKGLIITHQ